MPKYGYNGNPWKNGAVAGTLIFKHLDFAKVSHGIQDGWYADSAFAKKNVTHRQIGLRGVIRFCKLSLNLDEMEKGFSQFWQEGVHCSITVENYLGQENYFKPKRFNYPAIGICGRNGADTEIFRMDRNIGFWGGVLLNDFSFNEIESFIRERWIKKDESYEITSKNVYTDLVLEFDAYACYGARVFHIENPNYKSNSIIINSISNTSDLWRRIYSRPA